MSPKKDTKKSTAASKANKGLSAEEIAAMKETLKERKAKRAARKEAEKAVLEEIAEMKEPDRSMAKRIHEIVKASAPSPLAENLVWNACVCQQGRQGHLLLSKLRRSSTRGMQRSASTTMRTSTKATCGLTAFALMKLTAAEEAKIIALVKKAVS